MGPIRKPVEGCREGKLRIVWARDKSGNYCGEDFFNNECNEDQRSKFQATFNHVADQGFMRNEKLYKYPLPPQGNMGEFKTFKKRLFFFRAENDLVITHGATKKQDETDKNDITRKERIEQEVKEQEQQEALEQGQRRADGSGKR